MNNSYSLYQIQITNNFNADLIMRQYKLDKIAKFMEIKSNNPKLKQSENAKLLELSSSTTIQHYGKEINKPSPYRIPHHHRKLITQENKRHQTRMLMMLR